MGSGEAGWGGGRKQLRGEEIPISLQFSILLGRFACIFIQRVSLSHLRGARSRLEREAHNGRGEQTCVAVK